MHCSRRLKRIVHEKVVHWDRSKSSSSMSCKSTSTWAKTFLSRPFLVTSGIVTWGLSGAGKLAELPNRRKARSWSSTKLGWLLTIFGSPRIAFVMGQTACWFELMVSLNASAEKRWCKIFPWWLNLWERKECCTVVCHHTSSKQATNKRKDLSKVLVLGCH